MVPVALITASVLGAFGDRERVRVPIAENVEPTRMAVIAAAVKTDASIKAWANTLDVPYYIQRDAKAQRGWHNIGESILWFRYIMDNYSNLADFLIFLDDTGPQSWHVQNANDWRRAIRTHTPNGYEPLGKIIEDENGRHTYFRKYSKLRPNKADEWDCAFQILRIFNVPYNPEKHGAFCCLNAIVPRKYITRYPRQTYIDMYTMIKDNPRNTPFCKSGKWGYAFERVSAIIWG